MMKTQLSLSYDPEKQNKKQNTSAFDKILVYLGQRDHSEKELRKKLSRYYEKEEIDKALDQALQGKYLVEPAELSRRETARLHRKNRGALWISKQLKAKGLPPTPHDPDLELEKARDLLKRKFPRGMIKSRDNLMKAKRFLAYRGFDSSTIRKALNENWTRNP